MKNNMSMFRKQKFYGKNISFSQFPICNVDDKIENVYVDIEPFLISYKKLKF